jgi:hypothetical protein
MEHDHAHMGASATSGLPSRWFVWIAVAILGFYLFTEHRAHLFGALPWLLILACPLMHVFMHHGHGGHGGNRDNSDGQSNASRGGTP